jgi:hypothetical protein
MKSVEENREETLGMIALPEGREETFGFRIRQQMVAGSSRNRKSELETE